MKCEDIEVFLEHECNYFVTVYCERCGKILIGEDEQVEHIKLNCHGVINDC